MQSRIRKKVEKGELKYAMNLGLMLIQRSTVFTVIVLTRTSKGYFWKLNYRSLMAYLKKYKQFVRRMETTIHVERTYLDKGMEKCGIPNGKLRPIGAPNLWSKMVLKGIEMIMRELIENKIGNYQHGFMRNKGCQTASRTVINKLRKDKKLRVFEFDLKSFFNKVNVIRVCDSIEREYGVIGDWIRAITLGSIPNINKKDIKEENELIVKKRPELNGKGHSYIYRYGFTQGSPLSPLLCAYALELGGAASIEGLTMFADDGIVLTKKSINIKSLLGKYLMKISGVQIASDKPIGETKKFKFLGIDYDLKEGTISYKEKIRLNLYTCSEEEIEKIIKYSEYKEKKEPEERKIDENSMISQVKSWVNFYIERISIIRKIGIYEAYSGGITEYLRTLRETKGKQEWSDRWASTIFALDLLGMMKMDGPIRNPNVYTLPHYVRSFTNWVQTKQSYIYDVIDDTIAAEYYGKPIETKSGITILVQEGEEPEEYSKASHNQESDEEWLREYEAFRDEYPEAEDSKFSEVVIQDIAKGKGKTKQNIENWRTKERKVSIVERYVD